MYRIVKDGDVKALNLLKSRPIFLFTVGNTLTASIPGITVAGANSDLIKFTPPADVELLHYGKCKIISFPPATPDGKPTPALITYTSLRLTNIPFFVVDAGLIIKPYTPVLNVRAPVGENIAERDAMNVGDVDRCFKLAKLIGSKISELADVIVVGESIPAGTTTAGAVLKALGVDCKVSSSMPENPVELKRKVIEKATSRLNGDESPLEIIAKVGDPVILVASGIACGSKKPVIFAGGTQMAAVAHIALRLGFSGNGIIVTTKYVAEDGTADIASISPIPVVAADPMLDKSSKSGLRAYSEGFVKEGVGAGAATLIAYMRGIKPEDFLNEVEEDYEKIVECV
jgi:uncharacterized protein (TIGR00303 family)